MKVLQGVIMIAAMTFVASFAEADESDSKSKPSTKDKNTQLFNAGMSAGKIVKISDTEITIKVDEVVTSRGPNRTVTVNGRHVSVPTTKSKTVQKNYDYPLESDVKLVVSGGNSKDNPKKVQELKEGDFVKLHLLKHSTPVKGDKPEIKIYVSQVDYTVPPQNKIAQK